MLINCNWKTCRYCKETICESESIELKSFDYEEENEELEGLKCNTYKYNPFWLCKYK